MWLDIIKIGGPSAAMLALCLGFLIRERIQWRRDLKDVTDQFLAREDRLVEALTTVTGEYQETLKETMKVMTALQSKCEQIEKAIDRIGS